MALILNIDTATKSTSVALGENGNLVHLEEERDVVSHASKLTPFIDSTFEKTGKKLTELNAVAIDIGPGSYTGLRIGLSVAKGLCYTLDIPLIAYSGLEAMINEIKKRNDSANKLIVSSMNSRKNEIYSAVFNQKTNTFYKAKPTVLNQEFLKEFDKNEIIIAGTGLDKIKELSLNKNISFNEKLFFSAENMISLSEEYFSTNRFADLAYIEPEYLKPFITT